MKFQFPEKKQLAELISDLGHCGIVLPASVHEGNFFGLLHTAAKTCRAKLGVQNPRVRKPIPMSSDVPTEAEKTAQKTVDSFFAMVGE